MKIVNISVWLFININQVVLRLEPVHAQEGLPNPASTVLLILFCDVSLENGQVEGVNRVAVAFVIDSWCLSSVYLVCLRVGRYCCRGTCFNQYHFIAVFSL